MTSKVTSIGLKGLEGYKVNVEVRTMQGTEAFVIIGLPDASVKESKDRVTAALHGRDIPSSIRNSSIGKSLIIYEVRVHILGLFHLSVGVKVTWERSRLYFY
jgi:hypothetical protein